MEALYSLSATRGWRIRLLRRKNMEIIHLRMRVDALEKKVTELEKALDKSEPASKKAVTKPAPQK